ncbi:hypothetical protein RI845_01945 [Thalassotalea nanhaiensis]|uniref:DUF3052 domain-containing protein n=1 Tax=Thalassotalea nanhaiensis TaxID=3065648 RepID=A0ABY9TJB0_9GAMM|nr:hypothetical protein RI845_01945 [Colwelliaceae bacterium SQ345]
MSALFKKLNLKDQQQLLILNAPREFEQELQQLKSIEVAGQLDMNSSFDFVLCFVENQKELDACGPQVTANIVDDAVLWFAYPKKSSKKYKSDISRDHGWQLLGKLGYEGVRQVAIDDDWSALRFRKVEFIKSLKRNPEWLLSEQRLKKSKADK